MTPAEQEIAFWAVFPARLRAARVACGLTMAALADAAGVALDSVFRHEHGVVRPTYPTLYRLCRVLGICPSSLFPSLEEWHRG